MSDETNSDTLRESWESVVFPAWRIANPTVAGIMDEAIEYAAQLELRAFYPELRLTLDEVTT